MAITLPAHITEELAEETGWHIGDGSLNYYAHDGRQNGFYQLRGHIEDDRLHYITRIKPFFKKLYGIEVRLREMPSTRVFGFQIWSNDLAKFKKNLGLPLGRKLTIDIPKVFLESDKLKAAVIRGIFDTDGCVYLEKKNEKLYPRLQISTISLLLGKTITSALRDLSLRATIDFTVGKGNKLPYWTVSVRGAEMFERFMNIIGPANPKHRARYLKFQQSKSFEKLCFSSIGGRLNQY